MKAAQGLTPEQLTRLAKLKVNRGQYTQLNGARFTPARTFYHATEGNKRQALTERVSTEAEMVTALQQWVRDPNDAAESGRRKVNLKVYRTRDPHPERFIGVDVGKRHVRLIGGFASAQAAREHLNTHRDTLEKEVLALRKKLTQEQRTPHNRRRAGKPRREGKVTPRASLVPLDFEGCSLAIGWKTSAVRRN
ncbi:LPD5 domain-containing protein [Vibrio penaeicida]|uniref:LPD5 domain-containing protein n=1 Tax=Vibrio penaeicida TaxID=104609 RepID=UPI001CC6C778|nr:LPD5 domain-containing protein [Vibrio penaeicida]